MSGIRTDKILEKYKGHEDDFDSFPHAMLQLVDWADILDINTIYYDVIEFVYEQGRADERTDILNAIKNDLHKLWIEETNKPYTNQGIIEGLYIGIKRCDWYLSDDKEQKNE